MNNEPGEHFEKRKSFNKETSFHDTHLMQCYVENFFGGDSTKLRPTTDVKNISNLVTLLNQNSNILLRFYNYFLLYGTEKDPKNLDMFIKSFTAMIEGFILQNQCRSSLFIFNGDIESSNFAMFNHASQVLVKKFAPLNIQNGFENFIWLLDKMTTLRISENKYLRRMSYVVQTKISNNVTRPGCIITVEPILFDRSALNQFKFSSNSKNILTFEIFSIYKEMISNHASSKITQKLKPQMSQATNLKDFGDAQPTRTSIFDDVMSFIGMSKEKVAKILTTVLTLSFCTSESLAEIYLEQAAMLLDADFLNLKSFIKFSMYDPSLPLSHKMEILAQDIYYSLVQTMVQKFNGVCSRSLNCPWSVKFFVTPSYCDLEKIPEISCTNSFYQILLNFNDIFSKCLSEQIIKSRSFSIKKSRGILKLDQPVHYTSDYEFLQKLLGPNDSLYQSFLKGTNDKGLPMIIQNKITYKLIKQPVVNRHGDLKNFSARFKKFNILDAIDADCLNSHIPLYSKNQLVSNLIMPICSELDAKNPTFGDHYFAMLISAFNENYDNFSNVFCTVDTTEAFTTNETSLNLAASMVDSLFNSDYNYQTFREFRRSFNNQISHLVSLKYLKESIANSKTITEDTINAIIQSLSTRYSISKADLGLTIEKASSASNQSLIKIKTFTYIIFPDLCPSTVEDTQNPYNSVANVTGEENNADEEHVWVNPKYIVKDKKKAVQIFKANVEEHIKGLDSDIQEKLSIALQKYEKERVNKIKSNSTSDIYYSMFMNIARSELKKSKSLTDDEISTILKPINSIYLLRPKLSKNGSGTVTGHEIIPATLEFGACLNCGTVFKKEGFVCKVCHHTFCSQCHGRIGYDCKKDNKTTTQLSFSKILTYYPQKAFTYLGRTFKVSTVIITLIQMVDKFESRSASLYRKESTKFAMMEFLGPFVLHHGRGDSFKYPEFDAEDSSFGSNSLVAATALKYLIASSEKPIINPNILSDLVGEFVKENGNKAKLMPKLKHLIEMKLDREKQDIFTLVVLHLNKLMGKSDQNQITYESMGVCFAPVFSPIQALDNMDPVEFGKLVNNQAKVFEILIEAYK